MIGLTTMVGPAKQSEVFERALRTERRTTWPGEDDPPAEAGHPTQIRSDRKVVQAVNNLQANVQTMDAVFGQFDD